MKLLIAPLLLVTRVPHQHKFQEEVLVKRHVETPLHNKHKDKDKGNPRADSHRMHIAGVGLNSNAHCDDEESQNVAIVIVVKLLVPREI